MHLSALPRLVTTALAVLVGVGGLVACQPTKDPLDTTCTQFWRGYVLPSDHNYAGLGAFTGSDRYMCKEFAHQGVRAQLQHLRNYADPNSHYYNLGNPFEPRVKYDEAAFESFGFKGQAPTWVLLNGKWAVPGTTYGQKILLIYNEMRAFNGLPRLDEDNDNEVTEYTIMGPSALTAEQVAAYYEAVDANQSWYWKPEITPLQMAQIFIDEGNAVGVRGDVAFAQSILETAWFAWPNSPDPNAPPTTTTAPTATQSSDPVLDAYFELQGVSARN